EQKHFPCDGVVCRLEPGYKVLAMEAMAGVTVEDQQSSSFLPAGSVGFGLRGRRSPPHAALPLMRPRFEPLLPRLSNEARLVLGRRIVDEHILASCQENHSCRKRELGEHGWWAGGTPVMQG
ncbi:MAG: hypothetical protein ACOCYB_10245, partial [Alkalispirochaeta sp.]